MGSASAAPGETIAPARAMPKRSSSMAWSRKSPGRPARCAQAMLFDQTRRCFRPPQDTANSCRACRRQCRARQHQRFQAGDGIAGWRDRRARRARSRRASLSSRQRPVDFPQQHGCGGGRAAAAGQLAIDDDDVEALPRQAFGDQRSRNAGADDQRIAFEVLAEVAARRMSTTSQTTANGRRAGRPVRYRLNREC